MLYVKNNPINRVSSESAGGGSSSIRHVKRGSIESRSRSRDNGEDRGGLTVVTGHLERREKPPLAEVASRRAET